MLLRVYLAGCDDGTTFWMDVTEEQEEALRLAAVMSQEASSYGCMPTMQVREAHREEMEAESDGD